MFTFQLEINFLFIFHLPFIIVVHISNNLSPDIIETWTMFNAAWNTNWMLVQRMSESFAEYLKLLQAPI